MIYPPAKHIISADVESPGKNRFAMDVTTSVTLTETWPKLFLTEASNPTEIPVMYKVANFKLHLRNTLLTACILSGSLFLNFTFVETQTINTIPKAFFANQKFRHVGPVGNRVSAVTGEEGNQNIFYIGAASGGVFKSMDGGHSWIPIFDGQSAQSVGSIAVSRSDPNLVWVGTGESFIRSNVSIGNGIYLSTDAGKNWQQMGLEKTGRIGRIVIHPDNPKIVFAAAAGHLYGPQEERGIFRTTDGGVTWERVLFSGPNSGGIDIVMHPSNSRILFAATWQMQIWPWGRESGGPESGLWTSRDGGDTWQRMEGDGLPKGTLGRIGLGMSSNDPDKIYALIETNSNRDYEPLADHEGTLWRSDDGGDSWSMINGDHALAQRPLYYSRLAVAPDNANEVHFMSTRYTKSLDGGISYTDIAGGDNHDMWIDPAMPDRMIIGNDQGVMISTNRGDSWYRPLLPIAQMYHVATDTKVPYNLYGNRQDGPSTSGPSNTLRGGKIPVGSWRSVGGCESGFAVPDTVTNSTVWSGCYEGILERHDLLTGISRTVSVWPDNPEGWAAGEIPYRFQWTFPIHISPHNNQKVYVGSQFVHQTTNGGQTWKIISPDLTTNDTNKQVATGGLTTEDASPTYNSVLFAIAESPISQGTIWTGSHDGLVHVSTDGGLTWANVTQNIPSLPPFGTISNIEPSRFQPGSAYITVDFHQLGISEPHVYKTDDFGASWGSIVGDLPRSVFSYVHVIREDPTRAGLLYLGTENSLFVSFNDGVNWHQLQGNLPHAPVHWLTVQPHFNDLVIGTYGRGFWILDDVTHLQQLTEEVLDNSVHLFTPRSAYRYTPRDNYNSQPDDPAAGDNPEPGASINFYLKNSFNGNASVVIENLNGEHVRTIKINSPIKGLNRIYWDLRYEPSEAPRIRTSVLEHSHIQVGDNGYRSPPDGGLVRPLAVPGQYTVRLETGDQIQETQLEILQDPESEATSAEMEAQLNFQLQLRDMSNSVSTLINRIEWVRKDLEDLRERFGSNDRYSTPLDLGKELEQTLINQEMTLFDLRLTGGSSRQDTIRWPRQLWAKISSLVQYSSGSDHKPTDQSLEVLKLYRNNIQEVIANWNDFENDELGTFNQMLTESGLPPIGQ